MDKWKISNEKLIQELNLQTRQREIPETNVPIDMIPGQVYASNELPLITIADGVSARTSWGRGAMLELLCMGPNSEYPQQILQGELFLIIEAGSASSIINGVQGDLSEGDLIYLTKGSNRSLQAGSNGLKAIEVYSPIHIDHLRLTGAHIQDEVDYSVEITDVDKSSIEQGSIIKLQDIPWTAVGPPRNDSGNGGVDQSVARSRIIWGKHVMLSFVEMAPNSAFPLHNHPEDQLMITLRGELIEELAGSAPTMRGDKRDHIFQPGGMVHGAKLSPSGADCLDVFWPVRPDYRALAEKQRGST